jgi:RNA polymerase sigma factor (TIGR02999 family)
MSEVTRLLQRVKEGDKAAEAQVVDLMYGEMRRMAAGMMRRERPNHTLQPTALINEAYLKIMGRGKISWHDRRHFFAVAALAMRQILADHARRRKAEKHGGAFEFVELDPARHGSPAGESAMVNVVAVHDSLERLEQQDGRTYQVVLYRFFCDLTVAETAELMGISERTVKREWQLARAWLQADLKTSTSMAREHGDRAPDV